MSKYAPTKKELFTSIAAGGVGLVIFVVSSLVLSSKMGAIDQGFNEVRAASSGVEKGYMIKKDLLDFSNEIDTVDSFFLNSGEEVTFIEQLETTAKNIGVKLNINSITDGSDNKKITTSNLVDTVTLKAHFEGQLHKIADFLSSVEQMKLATSIENLQLSNIGTSTWSGDAEISVLKTRN